MRRINHRLGGPHGRGIFPSRRDAGNRPVYPPAQTAPPASQVSRPSTTLLTRSHLHLRRSPPGRDAHGIWVSILEPRSIASVVEAEDAHRAHRANDQTASAGTVRLRPAPEDPRDDRVRPRQPGSSCARCRAGAQRRQRSDIDPPPPRNAGTRIEAGGQGVGCGMAAFGISREDAYCLDGLVAGFVQEGRHEERPTANPLDSEPGTKRHVRLAGREPAGGIGLRRRGAPVFRTMGPRPPRPPFRPCRVGCARRPTQTMPR